MKLPSDFSANRVQLRRFAFIFDCSLESHADLLRNPNRSVIFGIDDRNDPLHPQRAKRKIKGRLCCLCCVALAPIRSGEGVSKFHLLDTLDVFLRCLEVNPRNRPASALAVAAALPGGDPLAAALAAGDTPTPEMVAASEDTGALSVRAAVVCLALIIGGLAGVVAISPWTNIMRVTPFPNSLEVLAEKARDLTVQFGYTEPPADSYYNFFTDTDYLQYAQRELKPEEYLALLAKRQPPLIGFLYRQSPQYLATLNADTDVSAADPPPVLSGMVEVRLDPTGRLIYFNAVPPQLETEKPAAYAPDWDALFAAAGLDKSRFKETEPEHLPLVSFDTRAAWVGSYAAATPARSMPMRVEAAEWRGRPVYFQILGPWSRPDRIQPGVQETVGRRAVQRFWVIVLPAVCLAAVLLAWRNYRWKRGDLRGASRLAAFAFGCHLVGWFLTAHHVPATEEFFGSFFFGAE